MRLALVREEKTVDDRVRSFLEKNHLAVMATTKRDGTPHVAIIGIGLVDGRLWSSSTQTRVRTRHVRRDNRATLCVTDRSNPWAWLAVESEVVIHDGPDAVDKNLALYKVIRGEPPEDLDEYRRAMVDEQRIIYEFGIKRTYGPVVR
jgi:PPOX class probable F420-dependent enzyme